MRTRRKEVLEYLRESTPDRIGEVVREHPEIEVVADLEEFISRGIADGHCFGQLVPTITWTGKVRYKLQRLSPAEVFAMFTTKDTEKVNDEGVTHE